MTEIVKVEKKKVVEGEVLPPGGRWRAYRVWNPSVLMRRLGYTANPDTCGHHRKGYTPRDGWWCKECGDTLEGN